MTTLTTSTMNRLSLALGLAAVVLLAAGCAIPETPPPVSAPVIATPQADATPTPTALPPSAHTVARRGMGSGALLADETVELAAGAAPLVLGFDAAPLQVIRVQLTPDRAAGLTYTLRVVDRFGNLLAAAENASIAELVLPFGGTHRVEVQAHGGGGPARISVLAADAAAGQAFDRTGQRAEGALPAGAAAHAYTVPLAAGDVVTFRAAAQGGGAAPAMIVYGPDGQPHDRDAGPVQTFVAAAGGTHAAVLTSPDGAALDYTFEVTAGAALPEPEGAADLAPGRTYRAELADGSPLVLTLDGHIGDALSVAIEDVSPGLDVDLHLLTPYGMVLAHALRAGAGQPERIDEMQLPYDGRYTLRVTPRGSGAAKLTVAALGAGSPPTGGGALNVGGGSRLARFDAPGAFHVYTFDAAAGSTLSASIDGAGVAPPPAVGLTLLGPDGQPLLATGGGELDALAPAALDAVLLPMTGRYVLVAYPLAASEAGYYRLHWELAE